MSLQFTPGVLTVAPSNIGRIARYFMGTPANGICQGTQITKAGKGAVIVATHCLDDVQHLVLIDLSGTFGFLDPKTGIESILGDVIFKEGDVSVMQTSQLVPAQRTLNMSGLTEGDYNCVISDQGGNFPLLAFFDDQWGGQPAYVAPRQGFKEVSGNCDTKKSTVSELTQKVYDGFSGALVTTKNSNMLGIIYGTEGTRTNENAIYTRVNGDYITVQEPTGNPLITIGRGLDTLFLYAPLMLLTYLIYRCCAKSQKSKAH